MIQCRDTLALPGDAHGPLLLRQVEAVDGEAVLDVSLDLRGGLGLRRSVTHRRRDRSWTERCANAGQVARDAAHAVAVLRGMTHPDGGTVAAATASAEQGRDYGHRYVCGCGTRASSGEPPRRPG
ncbi:hypothetical protein [Dactylosporangium sp. NPDC051484]|uniref:hypothetical protein n=1 Tax=Dactylosporangium sp. NPDC051484 TaxID=3154942 RepID=UPI0034506C9B